TSTFVYLVCHILSDVPPPLQTHPLSLHDALPIFADRLGPRLDELHERLGGDEDRHEHNEHHRRENHQPCQAVREDPVDPVAGGRSEEHTSELQSRENLVCRLLLEKKKEYVSTSNM